MVRKRIAAGLASVALAVTTLIGFAPTASATDYGIDMTKACAHFTNVGYAWAKPVDGGNPYTWQCSTYPYPAWKTWPGSIDLTLWCAYEQPGSIDVLVSPYNAYSWRCRV